jgi:hypothetical protein
MPIRRMQLKMHRKAQVTLFILVAIILIVGAVSFFALRKSGASMNALDKAREEAENIARSDSIRVYVESCLEQATKDAVELVGRQGGYIYDTQAKGGIFFLGPGSNWCDPALQYFPASACVLSANLVPYETRAGAVDYVSYAIKEGTHKAAPQYPYTGYLHYKDDADTFGSAAGGEKKGAMLELCYAGGPNSRDIEGAKHSCFDSYSTVGKSVQNFLEDYIENKTLACVDFSSVAVNRGVKIDAENISAEVLLGETEILVKLNYALNMRFSGKEAVKTIADFSYQMRDMRLKQMYELAYNIVAADTTDVFFDSQSPTDLNKLTNCIDPDKSNLKTICLKEGMQVQKFKTVCPSCVTNPYSDIIQITDTYSKIDDKGYVLQFAVANRPPALDLIATKIYDNVPYYNYLSSIGKASPFVYRKKALAIGNESSYDIIVGKGDSLEIYPLAADPDEDPLMIRFVPLNSDPLAGKLEQSALYNSTHRDASLGAGTLAVGKHAVRLTVSDNRGFSDWQDLNILVCETDDDDSPYYCT